MNFEFVGFYCCGEVIFKKNDEYIFIKSSLPKQDLVFRLGIDPQLINKKLRDMILFQAMKNGKFRFVYSDDGENWNEHILSECYGKDGFTPSKKFKKLIKYADC